MVRKIQGWNEKSMVRIVHGTKSLVPDTAKVTIVTSRKSHVSFRLTHSFEQLTGFVYQIWLHLTEFTHCA